MAIQAELCTFFDILSNFNDVWHSGCTALQIASDVVSIMILIMIDLVTDDLSKLRFFIKVHNRLIISQAFQVVQSHIFSEETRACKQ